MLVALGVLDEDVSCGKVNFTDGLSVRPMTRQSPLGVFDEDCPRSVCAITCLSLVGVFDESDSLENVDFLRGCPAQRCLSDNSFVTTRRF